MAGAFQSRTDHSSRARSSSRQRRASARRRARPAPAPRCSGRTKRSSSQMPWRPRKVE